MGAPVAAQRVLRGVAANIDVTFSDQNGEAVAAIGTVTVDVTKDDGTVVATAAATTPVSGQTGVYRYVLAAQPNLELLSFTWKDATVARVTTQVDVVGGFFFSVAEVRTFDPSLTSATEYPAAKIQQVRREVEDECERITGCAWVPRYRRKRYDGMHAYGPLVLDDWNPRSIRSVRVYSDATNYTPFTVDELAALTLTEGGLVTRSDAYYYWWVGAAVIEYEYGYDAPPPDLKHAALTRMRYRLNMEKSGIPDRAIRFLPSDGGNFSIATAGGDNHPTGIDEVDAVYLRYSKRAPAIA